MADMDGGWRKRTQKCFTHCFVQLTWRAVFDGGSHSRSSAFCFCLLDYPCCNKTSSGGNLCPPWGFVGELLKLRCGQLSFKVRHANKFIENSGGCCDPILKQ